MNPTTPSTLTDLIEPLLDLLNRRYSTNDPEEFLIPSTGRLGETGDGEEAVAIELPDDIESHNVPMSAIATVLKLTGAETVWSRATDDRATVNGPLRFTLAKRCAWAGYFWSWSRYLVVDHFDDDLDLEAAGRQVEALIAIIEDPANLVELGPEERALF